MKHLNLRKEIERLVVAYNSPLREVVEQMDLIVLLRNAHPLYRADFAGHLKDAGLITKDQAGEFIKIVGQK